MPTLLTPELLDEFYAELRAAGFPDPSGLPGLTDAEMDRITSPLGLDLPEEARVWWRRHNGAQKGAGLIGPRRYLRTLEDAVAGAVESRAIQADADDEGLVVVWADRLLCLFSDDVFYAFDCSRPRHEPAPVSVFDPKEAEDIHLDQLASIGMMVEMWIQALRRRAFYFEPSNEPYSRRGTRTLEANQWSDEPWPWGFP